MKQLSIPSNSSIEETDLCARSGLMSPGFFTTLYVMDIDVATEFYIRLLGEDSVKLRGGGITSFELDDQHELFIQEITHDSAFADLAGTQSIGLTVTRDVFHAIARSLPESIPLPLEISTGGPAIEEGFMTIDPEGNRCLVTPVQSSVSV